MMSPLQSFIEAINDGAQLLPSYAPWRTTVSEAIAETMRRAEASLQYLDRKDFDSSLRCFDMYLTDRGMTINEARAKARALANSLRPT